MKTKGICYDVGREMFGNWRPDYNPSIVHRELEIIKNDLHCNAIRICSKKIERLILTAKDALQQGFEVWLSPELWNKSPDETLDYIVKASREAEKLYEQYPNKFVFIIASELTLFMQGIVPGGDLMKRLRYVFSSNIIKECNHNKPLNEYLCKVTKAIREIYHGPLSYASLPWEQVDWNLFDIVGVDGYRPTKIKSTYVEMLNYAFSFKKPVIITEFGYRTYQGAEDAGGNIMSLIDIKSLILHKLPLIGRFIRTKLREILIRDEKLQASELIDQLRVLDEMKVEGAFVMTFVSPNNPYDDNPIYDLDMASYSLVKSYKKGNRGNRYTDMSWEPKEAFYAVAEYYKK